MGSQFFNFVKLLVVPPKKGSIEVQCHIAEPINGMEDSEKTYDVTGYREIDRETKEPWYKLQWIKKGKSKKQVDTPSFHYKSEGDIKSPLDVFIDYAVDITGSVYMMWFVILILIAWVLWGAIAKAPDTWQIAMQDGQSIQTYLWDTFLMRQQMDTGEKFLIFSGKLKSRLETHKRFLSKIQKTHLTSDAAESIELLAKCEKQLLEEETNQTWFDKLSEFCAKILGNIYCVILYWLGVFAWIACGDIPLNNGTASQPDIQKWSNNWQMYINTAVAIELLFTSVFLEHVRANSSKSLMKKAQIFDQMDVELERLERSVCHDFSDNVLITVDRTPRDKIQKAISFYASVIGNGLGLIITVCVFIAWFSIGNTMHWNANWWLIIGTYTGLVGFIDGFVLREVYFSISKHEHEQFLSLFEESQDLLNMINSPIVLKHYKPKSNLSVKSSLSINRVCSSKWSVIVSAMTVLGLVIMACAMMWSETAQLICNTPTMIIEGFFLLMLIQAHNWADAERSNMLNELTKSRLYIQNYIKQKVPNYWEKKGEGSMESYYSLSE